MRELPRRVDENPRIGDVERAVRTDRHVVRELGAPPAEVHGRDGRPRALVERAHRVDVHTHTVSATIAVPLGAWSTTPALPPETNSSDSIEPSGRTRLMKPLLSLTEG